MRNFIYLIISVLSAFSCTSSATKENEGSTIMELLYFDYIKTLQMVGQPVELDNGNDAQAFVDFFVHDSIIKIVATTPYKFLMPVNTKVFYSDKNQTTIEDDPDIKYHLTYSGKDDDGYRCTLRFYLTHDNTITMMRLVTYLHDGKEFRNILFGRYR